MICSLLMKKKSCIASLETELHVLQSTIIQGQGRSGQKSAWVKQSVQNSENERRGCSGERSQFENREIYVTRSLHPKATRLLYLYLKLTQRVTQNSSTGGGGSARTTLKPVAENSKSKIKWGLLHFTVLQANDVLIWHKTTGSRNVDWWKIAEKQRLSKSVEKPFSRNSSIRWKANWLNLSETGSWMRTQPFARTDFSFFFFFFLQCWNVTHERLPVFVSRLLISRYVGADSNKHSPLSQNLNPDPLERHNHIVNLWRGNTLDFYG